MATMTSTNEPSRVKVDVDGVVHYWQLTATGGGNVDLNVLDADGNAIATPFSGGASDSGGRLTGRLINVAGASGDLIVDPETGFIANG